jgi:hypothetical protein
MVFTQILKDASRGVFLLLLEWLKEVNELVLCLVAQLTTARTNLYIEKKGMWRFKKKGTSTYSRVLLKGSTKIWYSDHNPTLLGAEFWSKLQQRQLPVCNYCRANHEAHIIEPTIREQPSILRSGRTRRARNSWCPSISALINHNFSMPLPLPLLYVADTNPKMAMRMPLYRRSLKPKPSCTYQFWSDTTRNVEMKRVVWFI